MTCRRYQFTAIKAAIVRTTTKLTKVQIFPFFVAVESNKVYTHTQEYTQMYVCVRVCINCH